MLLQRLPEAKPLAIACDVKRCSGRDALQTQSPHCNKHEKFERPGSSLKAGVSKKATKSEAFGNMFAGALFGGAVVGFMAVFIIVLVVISSWLPPESKEADDPTPDSFSYYVLPDEETFA